MKLVGITGSGSTTLYAPTIIYEGAEEDAKEEQLVLIIDNKRGMKYLGVLRNVKRYEPFLNIYRRTSFVDNPALADTGTLPHTSAYISLIGILDEDGRLSEAQLPPNPGSKVYIIQGAEDLKLELGSGLIIGSHKYSEISIPLNPNGLAYHIAVIGATGTGKSRLVKALIDEILAKTSYKVLVFDHSGLDYTPYYKENTISSSNITLDLSLISDLILERIGLDTRIYEQYVTLSVLLYLYNEIFAKAGKGSLKYHGLSSILNIDFKELHKKMAEEGIAWNPIEFKKYIVQAVDELRGRESTKVRLCVAVDIKLGSSFFRSISNRKLLPQQVIELLEEKKLIVVDLSSEDMIVRRYIVATIISEIWRRIEESREPVNIVIVIDEAHNYACRYCGEAHKLISKIAREGRKWKLGLILATQRAVDIDPEIRGNINTWIFSKLQTPSDFNEITAYMNLAGLTESSLAILGKREFYIAGLMNPLNIPILIKVREVKKV